MGTGGISRGSDRPGMNGAKKSRDGVEEAKAAALTYLSYRSRSIGEVRKRLLQKGFDADDVGEVIARFTDLGYLDDKRFAEEWVRFSAKGKGWGRRRIIQELAAKGIERETIDGAVACLSVENERVTARTALEAWRRKRTAPTPSSLRERQSAYQHLMRRGFATETVIAVIKELLPAGENDEGR